MGMILHFFKLKVVFKFNKMIIKMIPLDLQTMRLKNHNQKASEPEHLNG